MSHFLPFYPLSSPKTQNLKKMKKTPRDIIILHKCSKNYNQIMYGSWDMVHDRQTDGQMDGWMEKVTYRGGCPTWKLEYHFLVESLKIKNVSFQSKTAIPEANVKTNRMVSTKWSYHKEQSFASNYETVIMGRCLFSLGWPPF